MRVIASFFVLSLLFVSATAQELNLRQYLERLKTAPGATLSQKVEYLSSLGISLSPRGLRELQTAARSPAAPQPAWTSLPALRDTDFDARSARDDFDTGLAGSSRHIGSLEFHNFSNGVTGTTQRFGSLEFHSFSNGLTGTTQRLGNFGFTHWSDGTTVNSQRLGSFRHYQFSDGTSGFSQTIGGFTFYNDSRGNNCTTQRIGFQVFTNCR
ncbi:MAG: hypothetical protein ACP5VC_18630 [Bryobacteraceae bacterium]